MLGGRIRCLFMAMLMLVGIGEHIIYFVVLESWFFVVLFCVQDELLRCCCCWSTMSCREYNSSRTLFCETTTILLGLIRDLWLKFHCDYCRKQTSNGFQPHGLLTHMILPSLQHRIITTRTSHLRRRSTRQWRPSGPNCPVLSSISPSLTTTSPLQGIVQTKLAESSWFVSIAHFNWHTLRSGRF